MSKYFLKLLAALAVAFSFSACTITVVEDDDPEVPPPAPTYSIDYKYFYTSYCADDAVASTCEDLAAGSYVRVKGALNRNSIVTIITYLPGDEDPNYEEDFVYEGRFSDDDGDYEYFTAVEGSDIFVIYDDDFASLESKTAPWSYNFSNIEDLFKKRAK
ncbi:MAG: hypothetical protein MJZ05_12400 [Fibrobacter sp.]|nr:hypothetical protein [Fibrobacter sp.]